MDVSSIANLSMYMAQAKTLQEVGTAVLDMAIESNQMQGQNAAALMESAVNPGVGSMIDISV